MKKIKVKTAVGKLQRMKNTQSKLTKFQACTHRNETKHEKNGREGKREQHVKRGNGKKQKITHVTQC